MGLTKALIVEALETVRPARGSGLSKKEAVLQSLRDRHPDAVAAQEARQEGLTEFQLELVQALLKRKVDLAPPGQGSEVSGGSAAGAGAGRGAGGAAGGARRGVEGGKGRAAWHSEGRRARELWRARRDACAAAVLQATARSPPRPRPPPLRP
jgi:hypothetical protein